MLLVTCRSGVESAAHPRRSAQISKRGTPWKLERSASSAKASGSPAIRSCPATQGRRARPGIVPCHDYTGVRNLYLPDIARVLTEAGYVVLTFDYKGWGDSEGSRSRLAPYSRVIDVQAALTWLGAQDMVDAERLGIYGTSYGGATVVWVAAVDPRVKCVVSVVGVGNGQRWMRSVRRPDEYHELLERSAADRSGARRRDIRN